MKEFFILIIVIIFFNAYNQMYKHRYTGYPKGKRDIRNYWIGFTVCVTMIIVWAICEIMDII